MNLKIVFWLLLIMGTLWISNALTAFFELWGMSQFSPLVLLSLGLLAVMIASRKMPVA